MMKPLPLLLLLSVASVGDANADGREFAPELQSIAAAEAIIADKVDGRRRELDLTLARAYRSLRPTRRGVIAGFGGSRARARGWWRQLVRVRSGELRALESELVNVRKNRASFERDRHLEFAQPLRGQLLRPVTGPVVHRFGDYRHRSSVKLRHRGLTFRAAVGDAVMAPATGRIRYVGPIRGLGLGVILAAPQGWWVVLGGVEVDPAWLGRSVVAGEPLGQSVSAQVYLEARVGPRGETAVNPAPLLR